MPLHWYDLAVLVVLGLLIFGPKRLPEMGSALGRTIREFQKSMREATNPPPVTPPSATQTAVPLPAAPTTEASAEPLAAADDAPRVEEDAIH